MNKGQLAYKVEEEIDLKWKDTLRDICEVARICLHNLVGSNTPPLPRCYEQEFEQAAIHLGKEHVLEMVRLDSEKRAYTMRTAILQASERIGQARGLLEHFDKEARKELENMESQLRRIDTEILELKNLGIKGIVDSARSLKDSGKGFVAELSDVIEKISLQQDMLRELVHKVHEDPLTGVFNRRAWERDLQSLAQAFQQDGTFSYCIVMADLDNFKEINDRYGHPVGDAVLRQFAGLVREHFSTDATVYRYGGDEFSIISRQELEDVRNELEKLRKRLKGAVFIAMNGKVQIKLSVSFGLSKGDASRPVHDVISEADQMLYLAKKAGRDCIRCAQVL